MFNLGKALDISVFGASHAPEIGVVINNLPKGEKIDYNELLDFMKRRAPGNNEFSTPRKESDLPEFITGISDGITTGEQIRAIIRNTNVKSADYGNLQFVPRPGHADYTAYVKYDGKEDMRGGGKFSGRLTAPLCIAGGIIKQILARRGIFIGAHIYAVHGIKDDQFSATDISLKDFESVWKKDFPVINDQKGEIMKQEILKYKEQKDSVGGIVECSITGVPAGLGEPMFFGVENQISSAIFSIPAVKGIEFGAGFEASELTGSQNNDDFYFDQGKIKTKTNNSGGILGGITNGMPITFKVAFKPTPSISLPQQSVDIKEKKDTILEIKGRHDPCIVQRAVPVVEAVSAIVIYDMLLQEESLKRKD